PDTIKAFNNLAIAYQKLGRLTEAKELSQKANELAKAVLGENHSHSLQISRSLA
ncbi:hypothetical protein CPB86DRAFT_667834, partial [Serendipita vermifera]